MFRKVWTSVVKHGRTILKNDKRALIKGPQFRCSQPQYFTCLNHSNASGRSGISSFVGTPLKLLAYNLRNNAGQQFQSGSLRLFSKSVNRRLPLFAFLGIGLSQCHNFSEEYEMKKQNSIKCVNSFCYEVRKIAREHSKLDDTSDSLGSCVEDYNFGRIIEKGCDGAVYEASANQNCSNRKPAKNGTDNLVSMVKNEKNNFDLCLDENLTSESSEEVFAIKVLFNLYYESNHSSVLRGMKRELCPASQDEIQKYMDVLGLHAAMKNKQLPPHMNIIKIKKIFVDDVVELDNCHDVFPHSLPKRLNINGLGRNRTLYMVMKRYDWTLQNYLETQNISLYESMILFTQLVEGVLHLQQNGVAHRDLKHDNILINKNAGKLPELVITDFGCCVQSLQIPYYTDDVDKGGNGSLMAPEIANAEPGDNKFLDFRKSDLWTAATLGYEIFGHDNPFYRDFYSDDYISSRSYMKSDLPDLGEAPYHVKKMILQMLNIDPGKRPNARLIADAMQLLLWAPQEWLQFNESSNKALTTQETLNWLQILFSSFMVDRNSQTVENGLKKLFLKRLNVDRLLETLDFLQGL